MTENTSIFEMESMDNDLQIKGKKKKVKRRQYETESGIVYSVSQKARTRILTFYRDKFFIKFLKRVTNRYCKAGCTILQR